MLSEPRRELILANTNDRLASARVVRSHVDGCRPKLIADQAQLVLGPYDATGSDETAADSGENGHALWEAPARDRGRCSRQRTAPVD